MRRKDQQETSMAARKPSLEQSTTRPCRSAIGAKAMEWRRKLRRPHSAVMHSKTASSWPSARRSSGMKIGASSACASGSTWGLALSFR
jgi:hypothetical protein